jgi:hypothetical protein
MKGTAFVFHFYLLPLTFILSIRCVTISVLHGRQREMRCLFSVMVDK